MQATPILASIDKDKSGNPRFFKLAHEKQSVLLEPGKTWARLDLFKWVTRGLMEEPQSFHVEKNGDVELNGHHIPLLQEDSVQLLQTEINRRHPTSVSSQPHHLHAPHKPKHTEPPAEAFKRVVFHVKLDALGHFLIEAWRAGEHFETGLRGLPHWVTTGLIKPLDGLHIDPLQRHVEVHGKSFACDSNGALELEHLLNSNYSPVLDVDAHDPVTIRENVASPTGFDIHFWMTHVGARFEVKGHLNQERLDILQDSVRCGLLKQGTILRISPPKLLIRRRKPDGGEEHIPELPDILYLKASAIEIQKTLNHPVIRHGSGAASKEPDEKHAEKTGIIAIRVVRAAGDHRLLWMDCTREDGKTEHKALTHHNVADLNSGHAFDKGLDVNLSLDHRTLSLLQVATGQETHLGVDPSSPDADLDQASQLLTNALLLKPSSDLKAG